MWSDEPGVKLDPAALSLSGRELEIAQIIADETEAQRNPPKLLTGPDGLPLAGLLGAGMKFYDRTPWSVILTRSAVHEKVAARTGIGLLEILVFALEKCQPAGTGMWALFWYRQWVETVLASHSPAEVKVLMAAVRDSAPRQSGLDGANKRWRDNKAAREFVRAEWTTKKERFRGLKAECARVLIPEIKQRWPGIDNIRERQIAREWLKGL